MKLVCFGDSNTWGYDPRGYWGGRYDAPWPALLADRLGCTVVNLGENGREIPGRSVVFPADTDLLIIMLGTNDLLQGEAPEAVCRSMCRFLKPLNIPTVLLVAPPPMKLGEWVPDETLIENSKRLAVYYRALAKELGIRFADAGNWHIPLTFDGVHLTQEGHAILAEKLSSILPLKGGN